MNKGTPSLTQPLENKRFEKCGKNYSRSDPICITGIQEFLNIESLYFFHEKTQRSLLPSKLEFTSTKYSAPS